MAEAQSSRNTDRPKESFTDLDLAAAQQLMQFSNEDNNNNSSSNKNEEDSDEVDQRPMINVIIWAKIEEIFGKEEDICRPKKRRYRSLAEIYLTTKPVNSARSSTSYEKKVRTSEKGKTLMGILAS